MITDELINNYTWKFQFLGLLMFCYRLQPDAAFPLEKLFLVPFKLN